MSNKYQEYLESLSLEKLGFEYADTIGDEDGNFEWLLYHRGQSGVIEYMVKRKEEIGI